VSSSPAVDLFVRNARRVRARIEDACARVGREADEVALVAVTKYVEADVIADMARAGLRDVGENRIPALLTKRAAVGADLTWHMIGHLQRNKARRALPAIDLLHAGDGLRLLRVLDSEVERAGRAPLRVLIQVNVSGEASKGGFTPEELEASWDEIGALSHLTPEGLMTMAPFDEDPEAARPIFRSLREMRDEACRRGYLEGRHLSMGMSGDFEVAVEEGATIVRIGRILYDGVLS
jgi:pyridoxal phosphate enzyme (YggS family)